MTTSPSDSFKPPLTGTLRPAVGDEQRAPAPTEPSRPGSNVFNRMPRPAPAEQPAPTAARPVPLPVLRRRRRPSGFVFPLVIAATGVGAGYLLLATTRSVPFAIVCGGLGLIGAVFCHILLRDRVEIR